MGRKIFGITIIFFGALLLAALVYFVFIGNMSFDGIFDKFKKNAGPIDAAITTDSPLDQTGDGGIVNKDPEPVNVVAKPPVEIEADIKEPAAPVDVQQFTKDDLKRMSSSFAERFGSFSNHSNFSNVRDLKLYMSKRMSVWADNYILEKSQEIGSVDLYYGITTKAIAEEIKDLDEDVGQAVVQVSTRRREATSSTSNTSKVFNQEIVIVFIKENGAWKVDDATWLDRN